MIHVYELIQIRQVKQKKYDRNNMCYDTIDRHVSNCPPPPILPTSSGPTVQCDAHCLPETHFRIDLWYSAIVVLYTCKSKIGNDSRDNLSNSKFDYSDDGYMFEPSDNDTAGHNHLTGDSEGAGFVVD